MSDPAEFRPMTLRMPVDLYQQVHSLAAQHDRSAGAEVRMIVREALAQQKSAPTEKATP